MNAAQSDWRRLSAQALREGRSLKAASEAYRHANRHTRGNPTSGETEHRRWRTGELGELLRRGVPFHEARRRVESGRRNPDLDLRKLEERVEREVPTYPGEPSGLRDKPWLVIGAVVAGAFILYRGSQKRAAVNAPALAEANAIQGGRPVQDQLPTDSPYGHQTGSFQSSMDPTSAIPGGVATNTTVDAPWDVGI